MAYPMGEAQQQPLRVDFDRRVKLEFHGSRVTSVAVPRALFDDILRRIDDLRPRLPPLPV
jgi:hypothetical protein